MMPLLPLNATLIAGEMVHQLRPLVFLVQLPHRADGVRCRVQECHALGSQQPLRGFRVVVALLALDVCILDMFEIVIAETVSNSPCFQRYRILETHRVVHTFKRVGASMAVHASRFSDRGHELRELREGIVEEVRRRDLPGFEGRLSRRRSNDDDARREDEEKQDGGE